MENINFRCYRPGDEEEIVHLLEDVFRGWPKHDVDHTPMDYWRWKYEKNPLKKYVIALCEHNNKIVGCNHTVPIKMKVGDNSFLCGYSADLAVHQDFRKRGISGELIKLNSELRRKAGMSFDIAATRNPLLIKSREKDKIMEEFPVQINHVAKIRNFKLHLEQINSTNIWMKELGLKSLHIFNTISNILNKPQSKKTHCQISDIDIFDDRIDDFWNEIKGSYSFIMERSREYLNWRYCDTKSGNYRIKIAEENEEILGYMVLRTNRFQKEYPRGYIVDFVSWPKRQDIAEVMLKEAIHFFDHNNINIINSWVVNGHPHEKMLSGHGFINIGTKPYIYYEPIKLNLQELITDISSSRLHFDYGCMDWI